MVNSAIVAHVITHGIEILAMNSPSGPHEVSDTVMQPITGRHRFTLELDDDILDALECLRKTWGYRSRGAIVNRLLRELLFSQEPLEESAALDQPVESREFNPDEA